MHQIDQVRAYWDERPCNVRHSDKTVGTREYSDEVTLRKYRVEPHIPEFANFEWWRGRHVLEIGCGIGTDAISFAKSGAWVTAVDVSNVSLRIAKARAAALNLDIHFLEGDAERLDEVLLQESFDLVYAFGVLHHTPDPLKALRQIQNFCDAGTMLKLMVYHRWSWKALRIRLGLDQPEAQAGCPIARTYSRKQARELLDRGGYRVLEMRVDHIFPYSIPEYVERKYKVVWYFRWMPRNLFRLLERFFGWHLLITAVPKE